MRKAAPPPKRPGTLRIFLVFLTVVALVAGVEFYALWSSNRGHAPLQVPAAGTPP